MNAKTNATYAGTRKVLATASLATLLALPATRLAAADLTVDSPMTVTTDNTYGNVYVSNVLTIVQGGKITANSSIAIGDSGRIAITELGSLVVPTAARLTVSGRFATPVITLTGNLWDKVFPYYMWITDAAETDDAEIDFMRLEGAFNTFPNMFEIRNDNAKPAVVTFAGGSLSPVNASTTGFYMPNAGTKIILRGENGKPIRLLFNNWNQNSIWHLPYSPNKGTVQTEGACNVVFDGRERDYYGGTVSFNAPYTDSRLVWNHTGDFIFTNAVVKTTVDNALPYSESVARTLRFSLHQDKVPTPTEYSGIDLCGHSSKVGHLYMGANTFVTNSASKAGTLVFGADGLDSAFSGTVAKGVCIAKGAGAGTLTVGNAVGGTWGSEVTPTNDVTMFYEKTKTIGDSWPLILAGLGLVEPQTVTIGGSLELVASVGETNAAKNISIAGAGTLRKTGAGLVRIEGSATLPSVLEVAAGALAVCDRGNADKYWRLSFDFSNRLKSSSNVGGIGKIGLFDKNGDWVAKGLSFAGLGRSASNLNAGEFTISDGILFNQKSNFSNSPNSIFSTDYAKYGLSVTNLIAYNEANGNPVVTLTARLADNANPICWLSSYKQHDQPAEMITVESSPDGVSWRKVSQLDENAYINSSFPYYVWVNDRSGASANVTIDGNSKTLYSGAPFPVESSGDAVATTAATVAAKVASGATLDLAAAPGVSVNAIEVDWTSLGGTIRGLAIPANGTLALVNVPSGTNLYGPVLLTLDGATGAANFKNWTVTVNGRAKDCRIQLDANGALTLGAEATVITLR